MAVCHDLAHMSEPFLGFWAELPQPVVGLAPMDGVTDVAFRTLLARHDRPDVVFTEFTHAEGLIRAPQRLLRDFDYTDIERPAVAQIYGHRPEDFYRATHVVCELGFDGVDINMGCPAKKVVSRHCGAGMIQVPELAREVIQATRQAIHDWANGQTLEKLGLPNKLIRLVQEANVKRGVTAYPRRIIPYSVKTRLGYKDVTIEDWVQTLLEEEPAVISIHGRTLKQMYKGEADWEAIARAAEIIRPTGTLVFGNGDLTNLQQAAERIRATGVNGVLLGRASIGNPWIFRQKELLRKIIVSGRTEAIPDYDVSPLQRFQMAYEHTQLLQELRGDRVFPGIKCHLKGYLSGFRGASTLRRQAMLTRSFEELMAQLAPLGRSMLTSQGLNLYVDCQALRV